jgi:hypothetical protein
MCEDKISIEKIKDIENMKIDLKSINKWHLTSSLFLFIDHYRLFNYLQVIVIKTYEILFLFLMRLLRPKSDILIESWCTSEIFIFWSMLTLLYNNMTIDKFVKLYGTVEKLHHELEELESKFYFNSFIQ